VVEEKAAGASPGNSDPYRALMLNSGPKAADDMGKRGPSNDDR
jgi:hypothetical protein